MPSPQSCRTCRWFELDEFDPDVGGCSWSGPMPDCFFSEDRSSVFAFRGQSCPTWEARDA